MLKTEEVEAVEETEFRPTVPEIQKKAEGAFVVSGGNRLVANMVVGPYSASREVAAQAMGLHYTSVDDAGRERFRRTKLYPGAVRDVAVIMWLCVKATEDEVDAAGIEPRPATKAAIAWAKEQGLLDTGKDPFWHSFKFFFDLMEEVYVSRSVPDQKKITLEDT